MISNIVLALVFLNTIPLAVANDGGVDLRVRSACESLIGEVSEEELDVDAHDTIERLKSAEQLFRRLLTSVLTRLEQTNATDRADILSHLDGALAKINASQVTLRSQKQLQYPLAMGINGSGSLLLIIDSRDLGDFFNDPLFAEGELVRILFALEQYGSSDKSTLRARSYAMRLRYWQAVYPIVPVDLRSAVVEDALDNAPKDLDQWAAYADVERTAIELARKR